VSLATRRRADPGNERRERDVDMSELAATMLQWEQTQRQADALKELITATVLDIGKTQNAGNVRASYSKGRKSYDYEASIKTAEAAGRLEPGCLAPFETYGVDYKAAVDGFKAAGLIGDGDLGPFGVVSINWRDACKELGLDAVVVSQKPPSVTVKLLA